MCSLLWSVGWKEWEKNLRLLRWRSNKKTRDSHMFWEASCWRKSLVVQDWRKFHTEWSSPSKENIDLNGKTMKHWFIRCFFFKILIYSLRNLSKIQLTNFGEPASEYLLQSSIISFINISLGVLKSWYSVYQSKKIAWSTISISS